MKLKTLVVVILAIFCAFGCGTHDSDAFCVVGIQNSSSHRLENAFIHFGKRECRWGVVGIGATATIVDYPYEITPQALLSWDENGRTRTETVDLTQLYRAASSGRLIFRVRDDGVDARVDPHPKWN